MHQNAVSDNKDFFLNCDLTEINCLDSIAIRIADLNRKIRSTSNSPYLKKVRQRLYERRYHLRKLGSGFEARNVKVLGKDLGSPNLTEKQDLAVSKILQDSLACRQDLAPVSNKILQDVKVLGKDLARPNLTEKQDLVVDKIQDLARSCGNVLQDLRQDQDVQDLKDKICKTRLARQDSSETRSCEEQDLRSARSCKTQDKILDQDLARQVGFFFRCLFLLLCTAGLGWFVVLQTLPLYECLSFDLPYESAIGALVLAVGFAGLHAACPRGRTRVYCFGVCLYEIGLVGAGTFAYEQDLVAQKILQDSKSKILQESLAAAETSYSHAKKRYSDPQDKMHKNGWYFQNYVLPNLNKLEDIQHRLDDYRSSFETPLQKSAGYLKLLYRVLLVILLMTFTHHTIVAILNCFKWQEALP